MSAPHVTVVLLNWNGWRDTLECLDSLLRVQGVAMTVVVCDNASSDGSFEQMQDWVRRQPGAMPWLLEQPGRCETAALSDSLRKLVLLRNSGNLGFAGGNNPGIRLALEDPACEYVWLLNNDTTIEPDALAQAVARMRADPAIGICGSTLVYYHERAMVQALGGASYSPARGTSRHIGAFIGRDAVPAAPEAVETQMSYAVGAAMLVSRAFVEQVGLMREDYFLYYEEIDWAMRGAGRFRLGYAPASVVYHKEGATIGTSASGGSAISVYYLFRNRLLFTRRFYPLRLLSVIPYCLWDILKFALKGQTKQAWAGLRGAGAFFAPTRN
ncbi:glycosyltransferase family 2 protein [Oxalobacteraceae bacterium]|nr:glycosyltransferase family 2 protein [Oxalobacteraceae bacterium]